MQPTDDSRQTIVTAANVDLSNCDRELIHMPGLIQPHGLMLVLRPTDLAILQASENTATLFGVPAPELTLRGLADLLGPEQATAVGEAIVRSGERLESGPLHLLQVRSPLGGDSFDAMAHRAGDVLVLNLNVPARRSPGSSTSIQT
jgi:light-regulated signal transduction histidine kinase (bacteriophytochrome)